MSAGVGRAATAGEMVVFPARRPTMLVLPLASITELWGIYSLLNNAPIGWAMIAAPVVALLATALVLRPKLQLTREGVLLQQHPFSSLLRWENVEHFDLTRAGNRSILGYKLKEGIPAPRRQPAAALLRAAGQPFDGGFLVDSLTCAPAEVLGQVRKYLESPELRDRLAEAKR